MKDRPEEVTNTLVLAVKNVLDELIEDVRSTKIKGAVKTSVQNSSAVAWDTTYRVHDEQQEIPTPELENGSANSVAMLVVNKFIVEDETEVPVEDSFQTKLQGLSPVPPRSWQDNETSQGPSSVINADTDTPVVDASVATPPQDAVSDAMVQPLLNPTVDVVGTDTPVLQPVATPSQDAVLDPVVLEDETGTQLENALLDTVLAPLLNSTEDTTETDEDLPAL